MNTQITKASIKTLFVLFVALVVLIPAGARRPGRILTRGQTTTVALAANRARAAAMKPNLDLSMYRRSYTTDEPITLSLSAFNQKSVSFAAYSIDLDAVAEDGDALADMRKQLDEINLAGHHPVRTWTDSVPKSYQDQWYEGGVKVPKLAAGIYVIRAVGGGVEKRTWLAVTDIALITKHSRQTLIVFAVKARSGEIVTGLPLTAAAANGTKVTATTGADGIWRFPLPGNAGKLWISGHTSSGQPAFVLSDAPPEPEPYTVFTFTDRPIYRPGQTVDYKGTVRTRTDADAPNGFIYHPYENKPVDIEIRDSTDALVSRQTVTTNSYGSYSGDFQLASEPTLGNYQLVTKIGDKSYYCGFQVQAYRKPEYTVTMSFDKVHYLGGDVTHVTLIAKYYSGEPVANADVSYHVSFNGSQGGCEQPYDADAVTDGKGELDLSIPTKRLPENRELSVNATVTDLSRRSQQTSASTEITAGLFTIEVSAGSGDYYMTEIAKSKTPIAISVTARDYDNKPVATAVKLIVSETREDRSHRAYIEKHPLTLATDRSGAGSVKFMPAHPNDYDVDAVAFDSEDDKIEATTTFSVGDKRPPYVPQPYTYPELDLVDPRSPHQYSPGEVATFTVDTNLVTPIGQKPLNPKSKDVLYRKSYALVTVEGERLYRVEMLPIDKRTVKFSVPVTASMYPSVEVTVEFVQERQIYAQSTQIGVAMENQTLDVRISSDKAQYLPGEQATYTVTTLDYQGRPVPAEVGLGVVDSSIYAIAQDQTPNMLSYFYSGQQARVTSDYSFAAMYSGGAYQTVPAPATAAGTPGAGGIRVRKLFADTAYWNPFIVTDDTGKGIIKFTIPDNLTSWRATARAATMATAVGEATSEVTTTMPLSVRLELPRFYVDGDEADISAIVRNDTPAERTVKTRIEATGLLLDGSVDNTVTVAASGQKRLDWHAKIVSDKAVVARIVADGGEGAQDAVELTLPSHADGMIMVEAHANTLAGDDTTRTIDVTTLPRGSNLNVNLTPSIGSAVFDGLDYLTSYPYGCAEQTMSSFLPDIAVQSALDKLAVHRKVNPNLSGWVSLGVQKLYWYQHADGGWHWWEFDQTDGDMTAYVLSGLAQAKADGYLVDDGRLNRGANALIQLLRDERELGRRADWLMAVAAVNPAAAKDGLAELYAKRDKLNIYGQASLAMSFEASGPTAATEANSVVTDLEKSAKQTGRLAFWENSQGDYDWRGDNVTVTAHALRAILTLDPGWTLAPSVVRWLMQNRDGTAWSSTRSTAEVVMALTQYMKLTGELNQTYVATVAIDGKTISAMNVTPAMAFDVPPAISIPASELAGAHTVTVTRTGPGVLYESDVVDYIVPSGIAKATSNGITVSRKFDISVADPSDADFVQSGMDILVHVRVMADADYRHAVIEDPVPAGCEVEGFDGDGAYPMDYWHGSAGYCRQEVRDDKVVYFFDTLPKGRTELSYRLHCETPGVYRILPTVAYLNYYPEIRGSSIPARTRIVDR